MKSKYSNKSIFIVIVALNLVVNNVTAEEFDAVLKWSKRVELSTPVSGIVQSVFAESGKVVAKDEALIQLDPRAFKADLMYAKAMYRNSNAQTLEAKRELERQTDMYDRTMLSDHDLQVAKNNYTAAKTQLSQSQSALTKAKLNLEYSAIRAPFNAIVISLAAIKGQVVAAEVTPPVLVVVAEAHRMLARFYVASDNVNSLVINQGAKISVSDQKFQGKIHNIGLEPDASKSGYYAVDVVFDSKEKLLRAGQKAKVDL